MPHFLSQYWQMLSSPGRVTQASGASVSPGEHESTRAERLEHISVYARAGYFNMGYTVDAFQLPGESPPH